MRSIEQLLKQEADDFTDSTNLYIYINELKRALIKTTQENKALKGNIQIETKYQSYDTNKFLLAVNEFYTPAEDYPKNIEAKFIKSFKEHIEGDDKLYYYAYTLSIDTNKHIYIRFIDDSAIERYYLSIVEEIYKISNASNILLAFEKNKNGIIHCHFILESIFITEEMKQPTIRKIIAIAQDLSNLKIKLQSKDKFILKHPAIAIDRILDENQLINTINYLKKKEDYKKLYYTEDLFL